MKRSWSDVEGTPSSDPASPAPTTPSKKTKKDAGGSKTPAKAKLPTDHKRALAEEIISKGIQGVDVEALMQGVNVLCIIVRISARDRR